MEIGEQPQTSLLIARTPIAGTVIVYNSKPDVLDNINTYINQIDKLYVIDNSDTLNPALINQLKTFPSVEYIANNGNQGVAYALNRAAELALTDGFRYLLTMDDDTQLPSDAILRMLAFLTSCPSPDQVGIISGIHSHNIWADQPYRPVLYTMTSGNLLSLCAYRQVGPFRNDLFIDHVDHEYGLRLNKAGLSVIELPTLQLVHRLGERKSGSFGVTSYISHAPVRAYYIVRNGWVVAAAYGRNFPVFGRRAIKMIGKEWLKAILFEDQKMRRLGLLWRGTTDALWGRLGKLEEHA